jgi:hypothetical protein
MERAIENQNPSETVTAMLVELADAPKRGLVVSLPLGTAYSCRIISITEDGFALEVSAEAGLDEFQPLTLALVAYPVEFYTRAFLSHVLDATREEAEKPLIVRFLLPEEMASAPARLAHRTSLFEDHGLDVQIRKGKGAGAIAEPINISEGGIGIRFPLDHDPRLTRGDELALELKYGATSLVLGGTVKHADGDGRYGLLFSEAAANEGLVPGPAYQRIMTGLQRHWLQHRSA